MLLRSGRGALVLAVVAVALLTACESPPKAPQLRLDRQAYIFHGYYMDSEDGVDLIVEDMRYVPETSGTLLFEIAILNRRKHSIVIDFAAAELQIGNRTLMPMDRNTAKARPHKLSRHAVRFRTDLPPNRITQGMLSFAGVRLETNRRMDPFQFGFHRATREELTAEYGELVADELLDE